MFFLKGILGCFFFFLDHRESGTWIRMVCFWCDQITIFCPHHYTGAQGPTQTTVQTPPAGLTSTSSSSILVFQEVSYPGNDSTLLIFSGQPALGCRVIAAGANSANSF